jgi:hypothetical protein
MVPDDISQVFWSILIPLVENYFKLEAEWAKPVSLTFHSVLRKLYTKLSYHISINLAKWF